jgi:large subunit GTPase 1
MGKSEKTGIGRALVKKHNHLIQQSKEKGRFYYTQHKKILESITDVNDIDAVIEQAAAEEEEEEHNRLRDSAAASDNPNSNPLINLDPSSSMTMEERRKIQKQEEALHAGSLRVPRRPQWNTEMSVEELDYNERQSFLNWRRSLASLEGNENLVLTPFEKNLDIWRQLWRVIERSDLLVMVVDARNPLFYRCPDLEEYAKENDEHKRTMLLVNKADLLPVSVREKWAKYFRLHDILFTFWSAKAASAELEGKTLNGPWVTDDGTHQKIHDPDTKIYGRDELMARLQSEAEELVKIKRKSGSSSSIGNSACKSVTVGFVGYPNVGKSSTINALVGQKRTGVTSTPGKTKHFQTIIISEKLTLCDCPGLVFPSFSSSRYEMMASGVLLVDRMTEHREAIQVVADRVPRNVIENVYKIKLPKPKSYERQSRPPLASELMRSYCASRNYVSSSGLPDETRAARLILKDFIDGKLPHFVLPPGTSSAEEEQVVGFEIDNSDSCDDADSEEDLVDDEEEENAPDLEHILDDLNSFDMANGLASKKKATEKKESKLIKHHKKPQRKKDRTWRVSNDGADGMPLVKVFQKPANTGPLKV